MQRRNADPSITALSPLDELILKTLAQANMPDAAKDDLRHRLGAAGYCEAVSDWREGRFREPEEWLPLWGNKEEKKWVYRDWCTEWSSRAMATWIDEQLAPKVRGREALIEAQAVVKRDDRARRLELYPLAFEKARKLWGNLRKIGRNPPPLSAVSSLENLRAWCDECRVSLDNRSLRWETLAAYRTKPDKPDANGFVKTPANPKDYVFVSRLIDKLKATSTDINAFKRTVLKPNPSILRWQSAGRRLKVHYGTYTDYLESRAKAEKLTLTKLCRKGAWVCRKCNSVYVDIAGEANCPICQSDKVFPLIVRPKR